MKFSRRGCLTIGTFLAAAWPLPGEPIDVGGRRQLFIDDRFVAEAKGVSWHMNPPIKGGTVLAGDEEWDDGVIAAAGRTVMEDQRKFSMWYVGIPATAAPWDDDKPRLCYAESQDGIHWKKPDLGLYEWRGSRANNIIMETARENGSGVFVDPTVQGEGHYKLLALMARKSPRWPDGNAPDGSGFYLYTSADGLRWHFHPERLFPFYCDTANMAFYDGSSRTFRAFIRTWVDGRRRVGTVEMADISRPWPYDKGKADDFAHKHFAGMLVGTTAETDRAPADEVIDAFGNDREDPANVDHYTSATVKYAWADNAYFMFPSAYRHFPNPPEGKRLNDGVLEIQMAVSRDGRKFHRVSQRPYVERGLKGSPDSDAIYMGVGLLRRGAELYQYYGGFDYTHGAGDDFTTVKHRGAVFLARQRLDGFVSIDAGPKGGEFVTPGLVFKGDRLVLNMDSSATGDIRVELRSADGTPLPGFSFAESDPLLDNSVAETVTWREGHSDVSAIRPQVIRIACRIRNAKLFAFQFVD